MNSDHTHTSYLRHLTSSIMKQLHPRYSFSLCRSLVIRPVVGARAGLGWAGLGWAGVRVRAKSGTMIRAWGLVWG